MNEFNVLMWDFNADSLVHYDVMPYFRNCYKEKKKKKQEPKTPEEFRVFVENESRYRFWSRCEYEMIIHGWPVRENDYKIDIHEQVMMNIDHIVNLLVTEFLTKKK